MNSHAGSQRGQGWSGSTKVRIADTLHPFQQSSLPARRDFPVPSRFAGIVSPDRRIRCLVRHEDRRRRRRLDDCPPTFVVGRLGPSRRNTVEVWKKHQRECQQFARVRRFGIRHARRRSSDAPGICNLTSRPVSAATCDSDLTRVDPHNGGQAISPPSWPKISTDGASFLEWGRPHKMMYSMNVSQTRFNSRLREGSSRRLDT